MTDQEDAKELERRRIQRGRNYALGGLLLGMAVLFYLITIARIGS